MCKCIEKFAQFAAKDHFKIQEVCNYNPLFDYKSSANVPTLTAKFACRIQDYSNSSDVSQNLLEYDTSPNVRTVSLDSFKSMDYTSNQRVFDFNSEDCDHDELNCTEKYYIRKVKTTVSKKFIRSVLRFKENSSTMLGGSKAKSSISMDVTNIFKILNCIGEDCFWNANSIYDHLTDEFKSCKSPTNVHSRIRSIPRFLDYMQLYDPFLLPNNFESKRLEKFLKRCDKSLLRSRNLRQKRIMAGDRRKYTHTIDVSEQWRQKRGNAKALSLFQKFDGTKDCSLTYCDYIAMRNLLLCK